MSKIYVITGSTSGIGNELTKYFSKDNIVFAGYRNIKCIDNLKAISPNVIPFYIDMEKPETIALAAEFIRTKTDKVDTIINVAGCVIAGAVENIKVSDIRKQFEVNTFAHLDFSQKLLSMLVNGKIINISSMASFGIFPFVSPYCASKRALDILFNSLSLESGVTVVSVKPGVIATPLWDKSVELNKITIENCGNFECEMKYLVQNAHENGKNGLNVANVVNLIIKIDKMKKPKPSYTVGFDAKLAQMISRLPFEVQNKLVKFSLKIKLGKY